MVTPLNSHDHHPASFSGVSCCTGTHRKLAEFAESCHHTMKLTCTWKHYRSFHRVGPQGGGSTVQDAVHSEVTYAEEYGKAILCGAMRQPVQHNCESLFCRDGRSVMCICLLSKAMRIAMQSLKQCTIYAESLDGPSSRLPETSSPLCSRCFAISNQQPCTFFSKRPCNPTLPDHKRLLAGMSWTIARAHSSEVKLVRRLRNERHLLLLRRDLTLGRLISATL